MAEKTDSGLPRPVAIAWGTLAEPQSGPRRGLSHEKIVGKAIEIADQQGLAAVTMSRLAESLGFTTMSLYRYVANKDELLTLMIGSELTFPSSLPAVHNDWRENLRAWAGWIREMYRAHPWMLEIVRASTSVLMPASVRVVDEGMRVLDALNADGPTKVSLVLVVSSYVAAFAGLERDLAREEDLQFGPEATAELGEVITIKKYPYVAPLMLAGGYVGGAESVDEDGVEFDYKHGLDLLIEGVAARYGP